MNKINNENNISETLNVIKKSLKEEITKNEIHKEYLLLNKIVQEDGTILTIKDKSGIKNEILNKDELKKILENEINKILEKNINTWLNKHMPDAIKKLDSKK